MRRLIILALVCTFLVGTRLPIAAQSPIEAEPWYFATTLADPAQVMAYTLDGRVNVVLESEFFASFRSSWQIAPDIALITLETDSGPLFYKVAPDAVVALEPASPIADFPVFVSRYDPYYVFTGGGSADGPGWLVNIQNNTIETLSGMLVTLSQQSIRFSRDGQFLRYISGDLSTREGPAALRERSLVTGEERIVQTFDEFPFLQADTYGENWLRREFNQDTGTITFTMVQLDGSSTLIAEEKREESFMRTLFEDSMISYPMLCESNCLLKLTALDGSDSQVFTLPVLTLPILLMHRYSETELLVGLNVGPNMDIWLLDSRGEATRIGYQGNLLVSAEENLSPDGRWILVSDAPGQEAAHYRIWDFERRAYVLEDELERGASIIYGEEALLVHNMTSRETRLYRYEEETMLLLPMAQGRRYFDALPSGEVLYSQITSGVAEGIYLYSPESDASTLLVAGGIPIRQLE